MVDNWVRTNGNLSKLGLLNGTLHPVTTIQLVIYPTSLLPSLPHLLPPTTNNINNLGSLLTTLRREGQSAHSPLDGLHPMSTQTTGSCLSTCRLHLPYTINPKPLRGVTIQDPLFPKLLLLCMGKMKSPCRSNFNININIKD